LNFLLLYNQSHDTQDCDHPHSQAPRPIDQIGREIIIPVWVGGARGGSPRQRCGYPCGIQWSRHIRPLYGYKILSGRFARLQSGSGHAEGDQAAHETLYHAGFNPCRVMSRFTLQISRNLVKRS